MPETKASYCVPFIDEVLKEHQSHLRGSEQHPPLLIGINGIQGSGKTTLYTVAHVPLVASEVAQRIVSALDAALVTLLQQMLTSPPYSLPTAVLSIDDFYLTHAAQVDHASSHPANPLVQHRGQPSTHDLHLLRSKLAYLRARQPTRLPSYDKSAHSGAGDRVPPSKWPMVNQPGKADIEVIILEGWCVGFRSLRDEDLSRQWEQAKAREDSGEGTGRLGRCRLGDVRLVNDALKEYDMITDMFDAFIHIDAEDTSWVYDWREEAEVGLRKLRGSGMTKEQITAFVDGYYPSYELYTQTLRAGVLRDRPQRQLRLVIDQGRRVNHVERI